jgi:uncharacterized protein YcfJ
MIKKTLTGAIIAALFSSTVLADSRGHRNYAKVISVTPLVQTFEQRIPQRECWSEQVRYDGQDDNYRSPTGAILGGIIGAAIGNELGHHKSNKRIGALAGGVLGASLGNDISRRHQGRASRTQYRTEERCETRYGVSVEERIVGYDVAYRYHGETFRTKMDYDPGKKLPVRVTVRPIL